MKSFLFLLMMTAVLLTACKKDQPATTPQPGSETPQYALQLNVSAFSQSTGAIDSHTPAATGKAAPLSDKIRYLLYRVWDANTTDGIKNIFQRSSVDTGFGQILDTLPSGRYIITILASKDSLFNGTTTDGFDDVLPSSDIFYKRLEVSVKGAVNQSVLLDRYVSKISVLVKDRIPYDVSYLTLKVQDSNDFTRPAYFHLLTGEISNGVMGSHYYREWTIPIPDSLKGTTNFRFETYVLNTSNSLIDLYFTGKDATKNRIVSGKSVNSVRLENNKNTLLTGTLFDNYPGGNGVTVGVNADWGRDSILVTF
ncbi:hypothetical protein [Chitinophaga nivalis]|uniref:FimB/Mfa2 family fimbrial subunit n=1 Tax=Chitinophaga nivalis TaxID=2991709 RepID=A0ABT3IM85_9BACT|nr:hypothetical protein [Chitinophaga nivalis]MCW3465220.1 hypothetical protein [Chitinophaga nivalis]MCW3485088.1 hypothetical protein [Chitinophaga nivalis]